MAMQQQPQDLTINGLFLQFYLDAMKQAQNTLDKTGEQGLPAFNKHVFYLRSIISDDKRIERIDKEMKAERERLFGPNGDEKGLPDEIKKIDSETREFMIGFKVIHGCIQYLDHTLSINKRQVKTLADQSDPNMPAPPEIEDDE